MINKKMTNRGVSLISLIVVIITIIILFAMVSDISTDSKKVTYASFYLNGEPIVIEVREWFYSQSFNATVFVDTSGNSYYVTNFVSWEEEND